MDRANDEAHYSERKTSTINNTTVVELVRWMLDEDEELELSLGDVDGVVIVEGDGEGGEGGGEGGDGGEGGEGGDGGGGGGGEISRAKHVSTRWLKAVPVYKRNQQLSYALDSVHSFSLNVWLTPSRCFVTVFASML